MDRGGKKGLALAAVLAIVIAAMLLVPKQGGGKKVHPPNDDPWVLVSYDPDNPVGTYLGNGFISTRIMGDGVGSQDGKPLPCFMAGLYDDEKLIPTPTWSDLRFYDGKVQFKIDKNEDYKQVLDMKTGILTTYATWRAGNKTLKGKIEVIVSRAMPNVGLVRFDVTPDFDGQVVPQASLGNISPILRQIGDNKGDMLSFKVGGTRRVLAMAGCIVDRNSYMPRFLPTSPVQPGLEAASGKPIRFNVFTSVALAGDAKSAERQASDGLTFEADGQGVAAHKAAWAKLWQKDIIIDGPKRDQQAIHSCMFYLLQSVREGSQWSIPPMGLSDNGYSGHIFWDADTWMFPALILQHPELARAIVDYRFNTLPGAMANAKASGYAGAEYAWESGYTGREDTPPGLVYRYERHINGDIALAQWQYYLATGDLKWLKTRGYPVIKATADYWLSRVTFRPELERFDIKAVVPPDENADKVDNSVYTNAIAKMNLQIAYQAAELVGETPNRKWGMVANGMHIPFDARAERFIAHDGDKGYPAKQADAELLVYPLQFNLLGQDLNTVYKNTFDYYAPKVMPKGPAMSSSAHSVIAARLRNCDRAYTDFVRSYKPYLRGPFNYFNESASTTRESYCFLTGAAGPIQAALYGFGGIRMDYFPASPPGRIPGGMNGSELSFKPCLPKQWKSLKITGVQWHGKRFDLSIKRGNKVSVE